MSPIDQGRAAEEKMKSVLCGRKKDNSEDPNFLGTELRSASDEYARAVRELEWT
jgi:hypothetical protein